MQVPLPSNALPIPNIIKRKTSPTCLCQNSGCSGGCSGGCSVAAVVALVASQRYAPHYGGGWPLCRAGRATSYADITAPPPFTILFYSPLLVFPHFVPSLLSFQISGKESFTTESLANTRRAPGGWWCSLCGLMIVLQYWVR